MEEEEPDSLVIGEIFKKYMLNNREPFLFFASIPPYTKWEFNQIVLDY